MSSPALTAAPGAAPSSLVSGDPPSPDTASLGTRLRRIPAALSRALCRAVAFVRWLVSAIINVSRRALARVGLTMLGGVVLIVVLIALALTIRSLTPRG